MNIVLHLFLALLLIAGAIHAEGPYSFERSEALKPLIHWQAYGPDAFNQAALENKPIFLLLTAPTWCHWCQVYESEDYLFKPQVVQIINARYIPVYVDADQRQDLTRQYLEGGWPSTTLLSPDGRRLAGFSGPRSVPELIGLLTQTADALHTAPVDVAPRIDYTNSSPVLPTTSQLRALLDQYDGVLRGSFDPVYGGFGGGAKFPQPLSTDYALERFEQTNDSSWQTIALTTLHASYTNRSNLAAYHLFDPVEGGFHRYSTQRDWTVPHYEKMLYDNGPLLEVYAHLSYMQPNDAIATEVVNKTDAFLRTTFYDSASGGFWANVDAGEESGYYGQDPRPAVHPRVEKTKFADWNGIALTALIQTERYAPSPARQEMTQSSLNYARTHFVSDGGAYHACDDAGNCHLRGSLSDNAHLLMAFVEAYGAYHRSQDLQAARQLADYSLNSLYDWNAGGFFERNSPDIADYAPGENLSLAKPTAENGLMAYALLRLYNQTGEPLYLDAGLKTLGATLAGAGGLDQGYYDTKAAHMVLDKGLLDDYSNRSTPIAPLVSARQKSFWLNALLAGPPPITANTSTDALSQPVPISMTPEAERNDLIGAALLVAGLCGYGWMVLQKPK